MTVLEMCGLFKTNTVRVLNKSVAYVIISFQRKNSLFFTQTGSNVFSRKKQETAGNLARLLINNVANNTGEHEREINLQTNYTLSTIITERL